MDKFFSDKSKAKSRGLAKIGDKALAAADELLFKGEDGRWGYNVEAAEQIQNAPVRNPWVTEAPKHNGSVTVVVDGKKKVEKQAKAEAPAQPAKPAEKKERTPKAQAHKGYSIEKNRPRQNGVTRPSSGTLCGKVWASLDALLALNGSVSSSDLAILVAEEGWNKNNVSCEYYNWRKFMSITGRSK